MSIDTAALTGALALTGKAHGPGLFGLLTQGREVVFQGSVGTADLDHPRPITAEDEFRIGSVTKTYIAALLLQLIGEGMLALSDAVQKWLPDAVPEAARITVEMLLRMRSGLPDYVGPVFGNPPDLSALDHYWSPRRLIQMALTDPDRLVPDSAFRYCNTDYVLLGLIAEQATGESVEAQLWQRVFEPAGLSRTTFPTADPYLRGPHASGHLRATATTPYLECTTLSPSEAWTAGGIVATPGDVARFLDSLFDGTILDPPALALMTDCQEVIDPARTRGMGIVRHDFGSGHIAFGHTGGVPGFSTIALRTPEGRGVVLYQNGYDGHDQLSTDAPFITAAVLA